MTRETSPDGNAAQSPGHSPAKDPAPNPAHGTPAQGIVRDERGQEQPTDPQRARFVNRSDRGDDPPGDPAQRKS
jgi:hypothetical protein